MNELEKYIQLYFSVPVEEVALISNFFKPVQLKKGDYFLKAGRHANQLGFVQEGIIREFVLQQDKEITKWIATKGYFVVDLASFVFNTPARWNMVALTDCELYVIDRTQYRNIKEVIPGWVELEKLFLAKCFTVLEDRIVTHLAMTAEERYQQ